MRIAAIHGWVNAATVIPADALPESDTWTLDFKDRNGHGIVLFFDGPQVPQLKELRRIIDSRLSDLSAAGVES